MVPIIATYSIVAHDPHRHEWGVAVQSKFLAVGSVVPAAWAGVGAIATQSYANVDYKPAGFDLLRKNISAAATIDTLTQADPERDWRQVGVVDAQGRAAAYTGTSCYDWAGHHVGDGFTCQGNILVPGTIAAMVDAFEAARQGAGELADWLIATLAAGEAAGGDSRGRQSAAILVVRANGGYGGRSDRYLDLRVDDDPEPIERLAQLVQAHHIFFGEINAADLIPLADAVEEIQALLQAAGFDPDDWRSSLVQLVGRENVENRWPEDGLAIERQVLDYLWIQVRRGEANQQR